MLEAVCVLRAMSLAALLAVASAAQELRLFSAPSGAVVVGPALSSVAQPSALLNPAGSPVVPYRYLDVPPARSAGAPAWAAVGAAAVAAGLAAAATAKLSSRRNSAALAVSGRTRSPLRVLDRKAAPAPAESLPFDPLGLAGAGPGVKPHPAALGALVASSFPYAVYADSSDYISKDEEDQQVLVLTVIALIVLLSPTIGIQMARGAIASMAEEDDDRFRGNNDPDWGISPDARRKKKQRELQARLDKENKKKGPFGF